MFKYLFAVLVGFGALLGQSTVEGASCDPPTLPPPSNWYPCAYLPLTGPFDDWDDCTGEALEELQSCAACCGICPAIPPGKAAFMACQTACMVDYEEFISGTCCSEPGAPTYPGGECYVEASPEFETASGTCGRQCFGAATPGGPTWCIRYADYVSLNACVDACETSAAIQTAHCAATVCNVLHPSYDLAACQFCYLAAWGNGSICEDACADCHEIPADAPREREGKRQERDDDVTREAAGESLDDCGHNCWRTGWTGQQGCIPDYNPNQSMCRLECAVLAGQFHDACFNQFEPCDLNPFSQECGLCLNEADTILESCYDYCSCVHTH